MSRWFYPNSVNQEAEHEYHVPWRNAYGSDDLNVLQEYNTQSITTVKNILHISNATAGDIRMKSWYLYLTDFKFVDVPTTITGIEVQLNVKRGRIVEDTVQLVFDNALLGENQVRYTQDSEHHITIVPNPLYGGTENKWGIDVITPEMILDPTFGVCLRFQSHPYYPHNEAPMLHTVAMRIY